MELAKYLDWADETREAAAIWMAAYQQKAAAYYNRKVRPRAFKEGILPLAISFGLLDAAVSPPSAFFQLIIQSRAALLLYPVGPSRAQLHEGYPLWLPPSS
ncbi:hypothetical protein CK203_032734 [Vitis vinifera]|uniref:Uncharacterized protein n=1 Tax=Vitis vinifera TaxID=29760 RepID=A0A438I8E3_VITVI|nr:hypothetical protein CK203_032734 [Vitis vinifera]